VSGSTHGVQTYTAVLYDVGDLERYCFQ